ncbi:hypothetical protein Tco_1218322 [Tanacetum coccineum]
MRDLNKKNGDVCEKVRMLKVDLDRVQEALSRDPSSGHLREDELVYSEVYRKAVIDEELLLKQKSKIQWLKEGDFHSAYFHNMVKGRVIKSRIESVYDEDGNVFHNDDMAAKFMEHFKKFFVSDEEDLRWHYLIIEDNKASGLDGYTSKFFKSAWSVVGKDTCAAVKEFFSSDLISASMLRRGLDEFCLSSGLLPSMSKSKAFFGNVPNSVKADISLVMPFKEGVLPIKYLGVPMVSKMITDRDCMVMVEIIRKRVGDWRNKSLLFASSLLDLRSKIERFVQVKIGNGWDCNIWFDKWNPRGPLSRLINQRVMEHANMSLKLRVSDMIEGNKWVWPIEWDDRFEEVINVPVPKLITDVNDKTVWVDKH